MLTPRIDRILNQDTNEKESGNLFRKEGVSIFFSFMLYFLEGMRKIVNGGNYEKANVVSGDDF